VRGGAVGVVVKVVVQLLFLPLFQALEVRLCFFCYLCVRERIKIELVGRTDGRIDGSGITTNTKPHTSKSSAASCGWKWRRKKPREICRHRTGSPSGGTVAVKSVYVGVCMCELRCGW
jgi:hypothetical protein